MYHKALLELYKLIGEGVEYPEAEFRVSEKYKIKAEILRKMYDKSQMEF